MMIIETEMEVDGRWIAEVMDISGSLAYGPSQEEAVKSARAIAASIGAESD